MSYDRHTEEHHLTPAGWVTGPRPSDAVETWLKKTEQSSGYSEEEIDWQQTWVSDTATQVERAELNTKFQHPSVADEERLARIRKVNSQLRKWKQKKKSRSLT